MFSLVITIISIALVAVLALATLYYGGSAFNKSGAEADAAKIVLQGQQLLGAADLYFTQNRVWPTQAELTAGGEYLKSMPVAQLQSIGQANAASNPWTMPSDRVPLFKLDSQTSQAVCAAVNIRGSLGKRGILSKAYPELTAQCFGAAGQYRVVFKKFSTADSLDGALLTPAEVSVTPVPSDNTSPDWSLPPGETPNGGGGGGGGPVTPVDPNENPTNGTVPANVGGLSVSFTTYKFGGFLPEEGGTAPAQPVLRNTTANDITLNPASFATGDFFAVDFGYPPSTCTGVLPAGQECSLVLGFYPWGSNYGLVSDRATLSTSVGDIEFNLSGTILTPPHTISYTVKDGATVITPGYGNAAYKIETEVGQPITRTWTITNTDTVAGAIHTQWRSYYYDYYPQYQHGFQSTSNCGVVMAPGQSCTVTITFAPQEASPLWEQNVYQYSWMLVVPGEGAPNQAPTEDQPLGTKAFQINNKATPAPVPDLEFLPGSYAFPNANVGDQLSRSPRLRNNSSQPIQVLSVTASAGGGFIVDYTNCTDPNDPEGSYPPGFGGPIPAGGECEVSFRMPLSGPGQYSSTISATYAGGTATLGLTATVSGSPLYVFGFQPQQAIEVGTSAIFTGEMKNIGTSTLTNPTFSSSDSELTFVASNCSAGIAPGASCYYDFQYSPLTVVLQKNVPITITVNSSSGLLSKTQNEIVGSTDEVVVPPGGGGGGGGGRVNFIAEAGAQAAQVPVQLSPYTDTCSGTASVFNNCAKGKIAAAQGKQCELIPVEHSWAFPTMWQTRISCV